MKIFLTGSDGFIGQHITKTLELNHTIHHMKSNLLDHHEVREEVKKVDPDLIIHLAARTEVQESFVEQVTFSEINYVGTVNLIESAIRLKNLKNFIFASTMEVYGWQPISDQVEQTGQPENWLLFDENTPTNPNCPYAVAKLACENYLRYASRSQGLPFTIIRQTNTYGRKDNNYFVTEQIISQMLSNDKEINLGYAEPFRNFLYIDDMIEMWSSVVENFDKCVGKTFTIGPEQAIKIKDFADLIAKKLNWKGKINWNTKPPRPGEIYWLCSSHRSITETTGWRPKTPLSDGLDKTIEFWSKKNAR